MKPRYLTLLLSSAALSLLPLTSHALTLSSTDIVEGSPMDKRFEFNSFGCSGPNLSPELSWKDAPKGTKSYAITAFDPDAPTESGFWQWVVIDIPTSVTKFDKGASGKISKGVERSNDYSTQGYGGPCPPKGDGMHRYEFTVWALPTEKLNIPEGATNAVVGFMLNATALDKSKITATYTRK